MKKLSRHRPVLAILTILFLWANYAQAQENISTTRPTSAIGAWTLPANSFQFEQGFTYNQDTLILDGFFRLAVSKIGEIRVLTLYGSNSIVFEGKVMILKPDEYKLGLAARISLTSDLLVSDFRLIATQKINDRFSFIGNVGVLPGNDFYGIALLNIGLGDKFGTYIEGYFKSGYQQYNTGLTYLINSETQLDLSMGLINYNSGYLGVGFARRFKYDNLIH
jgi:hypothetical protein